MSRARSAFTLIELLVTVGVLLLLSSMLISTVQKVRAKAACQQCQAPAPRPAAGRVPTSSPSRREGPAGAAALPHRGPQADAEEGRLTAFGPVPGGPGGVTRPDRGGRQ
jgi:prepilin-type N-terminal cleavage/methylation domain-containing protein